MVLQASIRICCAFDIASEDRRLAEFLNLSVIFQQ